MKLLQEQVDKASEDACNSLDAQRKAVLGLIEMAGMDPPAEWESECFISDSFPSKVVEVDATEVVSRSKNGSFFLKVKQIFSKNGKK